MIKQSPIPKGLALILVSSGVAWVMRYVDSAALARIDSMSPAEYTQHVRKLYHHSFSFHFAFYLVVGGFYIGAFELVSYVIGLAIPKPRDAKLTN